MDSLDVIASGDLAVETGSFTMTVPGQEGADNGKYLVVWRRQADGSWLIIRDMFSSDAPPPSAAPAPASEGGTQ